MYQVLVQAGGGDIAVSQMISGTTYIFKVSDITYNIIPAAGQTGITITPVSGTNLKTFDISICWDSLQICSPVTIYDNSGSPSFGADNTNITAGSKGSDVINAINQSLLHIQEFIDIV